MPKGEHGTGGPQIVVCGMEPRLSGALAWQGLQARQQAASRGWHTPMVNQSAIGTAMPRNPTAILLLVFVVAGHRTRARAAGARDTDSGPYR